MTVDFIVSLPLLLAALVLTSEYGRVLQVRSTLDNAVADSARYLSRVPLNDAGDGFDPSIVNIAEGLITSRINSPHIAIGEPQFGDIGGFASVQISAATAVETPALRFLTIFNADLETGDGDKLRDVEGLIISSTETIRYFGR